MALFGLRCGSRRLTEEKLECAHRIWRKEQEGLRKELKEIEWRLQELRKSEYDSIEL